MLEPVTPTARPPAPVTLVSGPEAFLRERAVAAVVARARSIDLDLDATWLSASETTPGSLAETLSPSLFAASRVAILEGLDESSDDLGAAVLALAGQPPDGAVVILVHPGGNKGKRLVDGLRKAGVPETRCEAPKGGDLVEFVVAEARAHRGRIDPETASKLVDVMGSDLRGLASMTEQLVVDGEGIVTLDLVSQYVDGRADVKGWAVADLTVTGQTAKALAELRWALAGGTDAVLIVGALAGSLRTLTMLTAMPRGYRDADVARDLKVPAWKVRVLRGQLRGWSSDGLAAAMRSVAAADLAIKGGSTDHALALSETVLAIGEARDAK
jgi:DNA polymerase-3 subunit delta